MFTSIQWNSTDGFFKIQKFKDIQMSKCCSLRLLNGITREMSLKIDYRANRRLQSMNHHYGRIADDHFCNVYDNLWKSFKQILFVLLHLMCFLHYATLLKFMQIFFLYMVEVEITGKEVQH